MIKMSVIDAIILVIIGVGAIVGFIRGFIRQLASILGFVVGLIAAKSLYLSLAEYLYPHLTGSLTAAQVISFIVIWMAVPMLFAIVASLLTQGLGAIALGGVNRFLGFLLGGIKYFLLLCLCIGVFEYIDSKNSLVSETKKSTSVLYYPMCSITDFFIPVAKQAYNYVIIE